MLTLQTMQQSLAEQTYEASLCYPFQAARKWTKSRNPITTKCNKTVVLKTLHQQSFITLYIRPFGPRSGSHDKRIEWRENIRVNIKEKGSLRDARRGEGREGGISYHRSWSELQARGGSAVQGRCPWMQGTAAESPPLRAALAFQACRSAHLVVWLWYRPESCYPSLLPLLTSLLDCRIGPRLFSLPGSGLLTSDHQRTRFTAYFHKPRSEEKE